MYEAVRKIVYVASRGSHCVGSLRPFANRVFSRSRFSIDAYWEIQNRLEQGSRVNYTGLQAGACSFRIRLRLAY
jgi:hypothetical protein